MDGASSWLPGTLIWAGLALFGVMIVTFAAAAEMAFASVSRAQMRLILEARKSRAQVAEALLGEPVRLLSTLLLLKLVGFVLVTAATILLAQYLRQGAWWGWWVAIATVTMLMAQILPRAWTVGREERVALRLARTLRVLTFLLSPITNVLRRVGHSAAPTGAAAESIFLSEDGLRFLLNVTEEETVIEDDEKELIASIFEFGDKLVREVMVPRIDVSSVPADMPMLDALDVILKAGHSRIPVYSNSVDNVLGVLYAKDLLRYLRDGRTDVPLSKILRPAYFVPESKKVDELLGELQQRKVHMAIVVDEYGGTAGIVTIEDLLEEIVGEIQDEYDTEEPTVEAVAEDEYLFDARVPLDQVDKLLGVELPSEGGDTLGGFIYSQLGKVPAVGDTIEFGHARIEVLSVAGRRIKQVRASVQSAERVSGRTGESMNERSNE